MNAGRIVLSCAMTMAIVAVPFAARDGSDDPAPLLAALESPVIAGEIDPPPLINVGQAEIRPSPGTRVFLIAAAGRTCGVVIDGAASLLYRVRDPFSLALARRHRGRAGGVTFRDAPENPGFTAALRGAAVWGWDLELGPTPPRPAPDARLPEWLRDILRKKFDSNPERDMLLSAWNSDPGYRWAALHTSGDDLVLDVDPRRQVRQESLQRFYNLPARAGEYAGALVTEPLVDQPIGGNWWDATTLDLASIETDIKVDNDTRAHTTVTTRTRLEAMRDGLRVMPMALLQEWVADDNTRRRMAIRKLTVDGTPAPYAQLRSNLLVTLPRPLKKGETVLLELSAEGNILDYPAGDNYWLLGTSAWYPRPGATSVEWSEFRVAVSTKPPFVPFAAGEVVQPPAPANGNTAIGFVKGPMGSGIAIAGKYATLTDERDGARVHVSTYAGGKADEARRLAGIVHGVRGCLEQALGVPYPFRDLRVIEINEWGWGQAPPGAIFMTKEALLSSAGGAMIDERDRSAAEQTSRGINERIAHEVAHGWFPHVAKIHASEDNWLSESFAEYMSTVCVERVAANAGRGRFMFNRRLSDWKSGANSIGEHGSIYLAAHIGGRESDWREWQDLLYRKGPLVLHALRQELGRVAGSDKEGDRLFFTWIRSYVKNFTYKMAGTRYLVAILNQMTGKDWQPWFVRYVYGTETPKLD